MKREKVFWEFRILKSVTYTKTQDNQILYTEINSEKDRSPSL